MRELSRIPVFNAINIETHHELAPPKPKAAWTVLADQVAFLVGNYGFHDFGHGSAETRRWRCGSVWTEVGSEAEDTDLLNNQGENGTALLMRPRSQQTVWSERSSMIRDVETDIRQPLDIESGTTMLQSSDYRPIGKPSTNKDAIKAVPRATYLANASRTFLKHHSIWKDLMALLLLSAISRSLFAVILAGGLLNSSYVGYILFLVAFSCVGFAVLVNIITTTVSKIRELRPV